jgi:branched-chain amino acid aminotransferase
MSESVTAQSAKSKGASKYDLLNSTVFFNGRFQKYAETKIGLLTHALHYGTAVFEGIRAYWNEDHKQLYVLHSRPHYERLRASGKILLMDLQWSTDELVDVTLELLRMNNIREDAYIRPILYKSSEEIGVRLHGLSCSFAIIVVPLGPYVDVDSGISCCISSWTRIDDNMMPARAKITGVYVNSALAKTEAIQNGYDEAILLTMDGHVSEGTGENIFIVRDGEFITPPVSDNILEGITRKSVKILVRDELGATVIERPIDRTELYIADEVFLCGTAAQISPVTSIDKRLVGDGKVGPLTKKLQDLYFSAVKGYNLKYKDWIVSVY